MTSQLGLVSPKLTYSELINLLCILTVRIQRMEEAMSALAEYMEGVDQFLEFQNYQVLLTRSDMLRYNNKTPSRRLNDLEEQFKGLTQFVNEKREKSINKSEWS